MWGDVRVDVAFDHRPTVLADAHYLPFKDGSFELVKASHLLEHVRNPFNALGEMLRVATKEIILKFPREWDVLPWFISNILPVPSFSALRLAYLTRKRRLHLWIINPKVISEYLKQNGWETCMKRGGICVFATLEAGRKAKYFRWLTKNVRISHEYILIATRNKLI